MKNKQFLFVPQMAEEGLRFRRTVKINDKEESIDLLTLALKKDAEYDKVRVLFVWMTLQESFPDFLDLIYFVKQIVALYA